MRSRRRCRCSALGLRGVTHFVTISGQDVPLGSDIVMTVERIPASAANANRICDVLNHRPSGFPFYVRILRAGEMLELTGRMP